MSHSFKAHTGRLPHFLVLLSVFLGTGLPSRGQDEGEPVLRLEADGPTSYVTSLAFSPDGKTLYAGSWDKTVYVWRWDDAARSFRVDPQSTLRVPIGPGLDGAINTIAVSPDGNWLAAGGTSPIRGAADFRRPGQVIPTFGGLSSEMRQDAGTIYVFDTRSGETRSLRGHRGEVRALTFAPSDAEQPVLVSAAREWNETGSRYEGVVRVWQVTAENARPVQRVLPVPGGEEAHWVPRLAARKNGEQPSAIEIGIAWGDGIFRVWDVAGNRLVESTAKERFQDTVAVQQGTGQFFSGAVGDDQSMLLTGWSAATGPALQSDASSSIQTPRLAADRFVPRGIGFATSAARQADDLLCAVVLRNVVLDTSRDFYELWLYHAPQRAPLRGVEPRRIGLWNAGPMPRRTPQLATSPAGEHLAISREGVIYVYQVADVLAGRNQPQIMRNAGGAFSELAFVRRRNADGGSLGLLLSEPAAAPGARGQAGARFVFDLSRASLAAQAAGDGWSLAAPAAGNWRASVQTAAGRQEAPRQLVISEGGQRRGVIPLVGAADRARYALSAATRPPIVALATYNSGLPALAIHDAASGRQIRWLTAHSALIRGLAFSDDGQLLASVADDETVCVWRLTDLDRIAGQRGKSPGVAVRQSRSGLVVNFDEGARAAGLTDGDVLLGHESVGGFRAWTNPREFYDTFWNATPGQTIRAKRRRTNGVEDELALPVVQGIDERKPLVSLFVPRAANGQRSGWIAWSPLGPYQSSDRDIERYLGWHFNTGRPEAPVAFAGAGQYREKYFREGLIDALIKTGQPPEGTQASAPLPRPILDLIVEGAEGEPGGPPENFLVRKAPTRASVLVADLQSSQIERVELLLNGQPAGKLQPHADGTTWSAALDPAAWRPGEYRLKAVLHTSERVPQQFDVERRVRYQLAAPLVTITGEQGGASGLVVDQETLPLVATIEPGIDGQATEVSLVRKSGDTETVVKRWTTDKRLEINEMLDLADGGNQFELIAKNRNALAGHEPEETERKKLTVNNLRMTAPPVVATAKVEPIVDGQVGEALAVGNGPRKVTVNRVQLSGEITGTKENLVIESSLGSESAAVRVAAAAEGKAAQFSTGEVELKPGPQTLLVRRTDQSGPAVVTRIELDYRPPLPELAVQRPAADQTLVAGRDEPTVQVSARLEGLPPDPSFQAEVLVNGEPVPGAAAINREARTLTATIPISGSENQLAIKTWDSWNDPRTTRVATIRYLHLPTIDQIEPKSEQTPVVELALSGKSASPVTRVEVGKEILPAEVIQYDPASGIWRATAELARQPSPYEVAIKAHNRDGQSLAPGKWLVPAWRQAEPPPAIELATGGNVTSASYDLQFTVRSRTPLRSINIKHNRQPVEFAPDLAAIKPDATGAYVYAGALPVVLLSGDNRFEILAANDGGAEAQQSLVNYIDPPARIVIDHVETIDTLQKLTLPIIIKDRRATTAGVAPTGKILVKGRVNWPLSTDKTYLSRPQRLQLWVNGFQQAPGVLQQPTKSSATSEFSAFAVLNEKDGNRIQLALPDLTADISTLFDFEIDCERPVREQRLHVLIVGVGAPKGSEPELEARVLEALQARPLRDKLWRSPRFDQIAAYGPIVGNDITPQQVRSQLSMIKLKIDELYQANRSSSRPANDVVMIYLQGGSLINAGESFFVTTRPASDARTSRAVSQLDQRILLDVAVQSKTLANFLTHTTGAHVLMLDVTANLAANEAARWPADSRAAMLRYTWLKGPQPPAQAQLLAALPEALQRSSSLAQLDTRFAEYNRELASQYPQSSAYNRRVPDVLQNLLLGSTQ